MANANDEIYNKLIRHQTELLQVAGTIRTTMNRRLDATTPALRRLLLSRSDLENLPLLSKEYEQALRALDKDIYEVRKEGYRTAHVYAMGEFTGMAYSEPKVVDAIIKSSVPMELETKGVSKPLARTIAYQTPIQGSKSTKWLRDWKQGDMNRISSTIREGLSTGIPMADITTQIIGTKAARYGDGKLQQTRNAADRLARTVTSGISNTSRGAYYEENDDIMESYLYSVVLDGRTSPFCRKHSGNIYKKITDGPRLPAHPHCRTQYIPQLGIGVLGNRRTVAGTNFNTKAKGAYIDKRLGMGDDIDTAKHRWRKLGKVSKSHMINEQVQGFKKDVIGSVPYEEPYEKWFDKQDATFQNAVLGKQVGKIYRKKGLSFAEIMQANGNRVMTVDQLTSKYGN